MPLVSEQKYKVNRTTDLDQVFSMLSQILDQETKFLNQLLTFENMLIDAEVFSSTTSHPTSTVKPPIIARRHAPHTVPLPITPEHGTGTNQGLSVSVANYPQTTPISKVTTNKLPILDNPPTNSPVYDIDPPFVPISFTEMIFPSIDQNSRSRRNILDFFSPYSITELGNTASSNYAKMNDNFHRIGATERRLSHEQKVLAAKFDDIDSDERKMMRKSLFIELRTFVSDYFQNFMFQLGQVLRHNRLDPVYEIFTRP